MNTMRVAIRNIFLITAEWALQDAAAIEIFSFDRQNGTATDAHSFLNRTTLFPHCPGHHRRP